MRLSAVLVGVGALAAAGCESCSEPSDGAGSAIPTQISYTCGPGTHREGNVCVNNPPAPPRETMPVNP